MQVRLKQIINIKLTLRLYSEINIKLVLSYKLESILIDFNMKIFVVKLIVSVLVKRIAIKLIPWIRVSTIL